jgi:hypothetical protein
MHPRLGRHLALDRRSLDHQVPALDPTRLRTAEWTPKVPILDQSNLTAQGIDTSQLIPGAAPAAELGSCTGNSSTYALSALLPPERLHEIGLDTTSTVAGERWAILWYSGASREDEWTDGQYPPDDTGSSGLGVSKYGLSQGWFDSFRTATSALAVLSALQSGPVVLGVPWYEAWFEPDRHGFIDSGDWQGSNLAGGHEVCGAALEKVTLNRNGTLDLDRTVLALPNSWGRSWGDDGWFRMRLRTYELLRQQIDVYQFRLAA